MVVTMTKVVLRAVIPVAQYANMQPEIEAEADTYEEAMAIAEARLATFWNKYVEGDKKLPTSSGTKLKAFVGGEINYDPVAHVYTNDAGEVYLSGSQYAKQFEKPFDSQAIAAKMATKYSVSADDIVAMWELKSDVSKGFGTAIHAALELYGKYNGLATALERDTHLHDHPIIKKAVQGFYEGREAEQAEYEILIVDHANKRAGQIDRLLITGDKRCRVQDFKTNADLPKDKVELYWKQLGFYAGIMEQAGWIVEGLDLFHWDGEWKTLNKEQNNGDTAKQRDSD